MKSPSEIASTIRAVSHADQPALESIISAVELFPVEMLGDMIAPYLVGGG